MSGLPTGWVEAEIGSLCSLNNGRAFKPTEWSAKGLPIVRIQNLNKPQARYNYFDGEFSDRYHLVGGELLFAWSGTPGTSFGAHVWRGSEAVLNQHIFRVDFNETAIDKSFFRFAINQKLNELIDIAHGGVGLRHVTKGKFESTKITLPPLNEQKRIFLKLNLMIMRATACCNQLDRTRARIKQFRQSILSAAISGKLTEEWRETTSHSVMWTTGTLQDILKGKPRNGYSPRSVEQVTPVKSLMLTATTTGKFRPEYSKYVDECIAPDSYLWLKPDDILIQRANALEHVGTSALYDGPPSGFIFPDLMMKAQASARVLPKFLLLILKSDGVRNYFRMNATGTAGNMPKINQQTVLSAPASWPSITEQTEILRRVESLFSLADRLETRYTTAREQVEKLTPSLLAKAFRGELVPQDPNDEPASELLARIKKESQIKVKPKSKKTGK